MCVYERALCVYVEDLEAELDIFMAAHVIHCVSDKDWCTAALGLACFTVDYCGNISVSIFVLVIILNNFFGDIIKLS